MQEGGCAFYVTDNQEPILPKENGYRKIVRSVVLNSKISFKKNLGF